MPTEADYQNDIPRLIAPKQGEMFVNAKFSDLCANCGHTRAQHLVDPRALNLFATDECKSEQFVYAYDENDKKLPINEGDFAICECERYV